MNRDDYIKFIVGFLEDNGNYELIKNIVGARVFYNNMSLIVEKNLDEVLWNRFETNLYRNNRYNSEVFKKLNHYISDKFNKFDLGQLGFILENGGIKSGVYFHGDEEKIIFLNITMNGLEEEAVGLADFIDNTDVSLDINDNLYDDFIMDIIARIVFAYSNRDQYIEFMTSFLENNSDYFKSSGLDMVSIYGRKMDLSFIIGAGANTDLAGQLSKYIKSMPESLGGDWDKLVKLINDRIISHFPAKSLSKLDVEDFNKGMSNVNYFSPEMMKILDNKKYKDIIFGFLYGDKTMSQDVDEYLKETNNPVIKKTYFYKIAKYMEKHKDSRYLSFNYDDFFDRVYKYAIGVECGKTFNPHGFIKDWRIKSLRKRDSDVILSSFEYMNAYREWHSSARDMTRKHLDFVNVIIGNSLSDYEEQKVFRLKYLKNRSFRSFLIAKELKNRELNYMKDLYFRSIGVIYCPIKDYSEISIFLDKINKWFRFVFLCERL